MLIKYLFISQLFADEGMWPQSSSNLLRNKHKLSFQVDNLFIQKFVKLNDCSGGFISETGLILTNYHCILSMGLANDEISEKGFVASTQNDELTIPNERAYVQIKSVDVTAQIIGNVNHLTGANRITKMEENKLRVLQTCPSEYDCVIFSTNNDQQFEMSYRQRFDDIRLVFAPPLELALLGGNKDNYEWPRYSADFALLRAYKNNRPIQSSYLQLDPNGATAQEQLFAIGYPGPTKRWEPSYILKYHLEVIYPLQISLQKMAQKIYTTVQPKSHADLEVLFILENQLKRTEGILENIQSIQLMKKRLRREEMQRKSISVAEVRKEYIKNETAIKQLQIEQVKYEDAQLLVEWLYWLIEPLAIIESTYLGAPPTHKITIAEESEHKQRMCYATSLILRYYPDLLPNQTDDWCARLAHDHFLSHRQHLLPTMNKADFESSTSTWIQLTLAITRWQQKQRLQEIHRLGMLHSLHKNQLKIKRRFNLISKYPTTNRAIRISTGKQIKAVQPSQTTLQNLPKRYPNSQVASYINGTLSESSFADPSTRDIPCNFLSDIDSTSGSSGSPTLNDQGHVIGLVFDNYYETLGGTWHYQPAKATTIHVDIRFMLYFLHRNDKMKRIFTEVEQGFVKQQK